MRSKPIISVSLVTYNHEKYIADAIRSVLAQSFGEFEVLVVNDGSTDSTAAVVSGFSDARVKLINQLNQGPSAATNTAIAAARGKYIALFSGDDLCHPDRLRAQLAEYERGPSRVLFSDIDFVDDIGRPLTTGHFAENSFPAESMTRAQMLARLFLRGNFLNGVTVFTETEIMANARYDASLLQLSDFELWARLIAKYELQIMPEKLLSYRIRAGGGNLSAPDGDSVIRSANEHYLILRRFFDSVPLDLFREAFADLMVRPDAQGDTEYLCEQAFLYTKLPWGMGRAIGVERLHQLLNDPASAAVLANKYQYGPIQFFETLRVIDGFNLFNNQWSSLFFDTGAGWTAKQEIRRPIQPELRDFALRFKLPAVNCLRAVRWDPVEGKLCRVRISAIDERDAAGRVHTVDPSVVTHNGHALSDGRVEFDTFDPSFVWPVREGTVGVTIHGHWEFDHLPLVVKELRDEVDELKLALHRARMSSPRRIATDAWQQTRKVFNRMKAS